MSDEDVAVVEHVDDATVELDGAMDDEDYHYTNDQDSAPEYFSGGQDDGVKKKTFKKNK